MGRLPATGGVYVVAKGRRCRPAALPVARRILPPSAAFKTHVEIIEIYLIVFSAAKVSTKVSAQNLKLSPFIMSPLSSSTCSFIAPPMVWSKRALSIGVLAGGLLAKERNAGQRCFAQLNRWHFFGALCTSQSH
jgi:hypothetical protein